MTRKPTGRHRVTAAPRLTLDRIVARFHDEFWRAVDDGRTVEDAAELARIDLRDRRGLVSR